MYKELISGSCSHVIFFSNFNTQNLLYSSSSFTWGEPFTQNLSTEFCIFE